MLLALILPPHGYALAAAIDDADGVDVESAAGCRVRRALVIDAAAIIELKETLMPVNIRHTHAVLQPPVIHCIMLD